MGAGKNPLIICSFGTDANLPLQCLKVSCSKQRLRGFNRSGGDDDDVNFVFISSRSTRIYHILCSLI